MENSEWLKKLQRNLWQEVIYSWGYLYRVLNTEPNILEISVISLCHMRINTKNMLGTVYNLENGKDLFQLYTQLDQIESLFFLKFFLSTIL